MRVNYDEESMFDVIFGSFTHFASWNRNLSLVSEPQVLGTNAMGTAHNAA